MRSEYLIKLDGTFLIDCCEARKKALEKEGSVEVLIHAENIPEVTRHCPKWLGCLNEVK